MPVAFIQEFRIQGGDRTTTNYDAVQERLNARENRPEGAIFHSAGFDEDAGVFRIFDVWETREHGERFMRERVEPVLQELMQQRAEARPPERQAWYDLHDFMS